MTDTTTTGAILVQDTLGRVRTPREKREQILDEYERSGMSGAAFAALVGVKYPTLAWWIQQRRKDRKSASLATAATLRWVEAVAEREVTAAPATGALRVQIGAAVWLEVSSAEQASWAGQMLRAMGVERC
jgi:transposase-like protein